MSDGRFTEQLMIAEQLYRGREMMLEPRDLPGRFGRVIADLERLLTAADALAVVAGGWAVWRHGFIGRVTQDVDVVIAKDAEPDLLRAGPVCGFEVLTAPAGRWPKLLHRETGIEVDLLPESSFPGTSDNRGPVPIRHPADYGAQRNRLGYIPIEYLFELKLGAGRAKDRADLVELIKVNRSELPRIRASLAEVHVDYPEQLDRLIATADAEEA